MALDSGRRIGAYEIVGPLGSGGMGEVYRARDTRLGRLVAIKLVSGEVATDRSAHERLEREARLTSSLNHPNIVTVHDVGEVDGQPYIVMEFVAGETLHARMAGRRLKLKDVIAIGAQVAEGLAAAHGAGVVHRDLKPRNIMITEDGRVKILDFGLGKVTPTTARSDDPTVEIPDLTNSQEVVGTAGYMAPEQVTNGRIDNRTDQFALGTILYE
ncbi:MAG TPA: serine/threonine-protein kinase, partial [Vicinamibacterales bacterium]|nr:serine/threonine-protein kinase [Vicinamibacterales bacterium]